MKFLYKYGTRREEIRRARRELYIRIFMVGAVLTFFALMLLLTQFRPRLPEESEVSQPDPTPAGDPMSNPHLVRLRLEVDELLAKYKLAASDQPFDLENIKLLEEALQVQDEVLTSRGSDIAPKVDVDRLEEIKGLRDEAMGHFLIAQSLRQEKEAQAAWQAGDADRALDMIRRSRQVQNEINEFYPGSSNRDSARLHRLDNLIIAWQTQPQAEEADQLKEKAYELAGQEQYDEAIAAIEEALEIQQSLNENFRKSRFATLARLRAFQDAALEIAAAPEMALVRDRLKEAETALEAVQPEKAMQLASEAMTIQQRLVSRLPQHNNDQSQLLERINILRETAASLRAFQELQDLARGTDAALLERDIPSFRETVATWLRQSRAFVEKFPKSQHLSKVSLEKVEYLHQRQEAVGPVMEMVYSRLIPVPEVDSLTMYATEVSQALYESVMDINPSSDPRPGGPVESVTWLEARDFARKLGWILARPVDLPNEDAFRSALGEVESAHINTIAWSSGNSGRQTQPVGTLQQNRNGYFDLLGNVAEWLGTGETGLEVRAIGGSSRDSAARLATVPLEYRSSTERNRFIGFRFMVNMENRAPDTNDF